MKTPSRPVRTAIVLLAGIVGLGGCTRETPHPPPLTKVVITNVSTPPPPQTNAPVAAPPAPVAVAPTATVKAERMPLPPTVAEVVDLAQSQVGDAVLLEFIAKSTNVFELSADQIIYLKDVGISEPVLAALVQRSQDAGAVQAASPETAKPVAPTAVVTAPATEIAPPPPQASTPAPVSVASQPAAPVYADGGAPPPPAPSESVYAQPVTQVTQSYFYTTLTPYGAWVEIPGYGWCWQPTVAVVDPLWRPYCHGGRWLYTDCGWYWQSTYSWGWAPFHYGTWYRSSVCGWVWVPGYTWSPAWVTWRYTDTYCGWAPLPPGCGWSTGVGLTYYGSGVSASFSFGLGWDCFSFVSYRHFCEPHPHRHCLPRREATVVYNRSTIINNYGHGDHHVVVNRGIAPSRVSAATRSEVRKVAIRDVTDDANAPRRADRLEGDGRHLAVYRPQPSTGGGARPNPAARTDAPGSKPNAPERTASPSQITGALAPSGVPLSSGRTRSENAPPTRSSVPTAAAPAASVSSPPTAPGSRQPNPSSAPRATGTVSPPAPRSTGAASGGNSSAPARVVRPEAAPRTSATPPTSAVPSRQPGRVEGAPAVRSTAPTPVAPSPVGRPSAPTSRPTPSSLAPASSGAAPRAPVSVPPASTTRSGSSAPAQSQAPSRTEPMRNELRKVEPVAPSSVPAPKRSPESRSVYGSASAPVSVPAAPRSAAPSVSPPAPRVPSAAGRSAPEAVAPPRPSSPASSAPAYNAPSRTPASTPAPSAPRSSGGRSSAGGRARSVAD